MRETKRKNFTGEIKAKVALEAIRGLKTVNEIGQAHPRGENATHPCRARIHSLRIPLRSRATCCAKPLLHLECVQLPNPG